MTGKPSTLETASKIEATREKRTLTLRVNDGRGQAERREESRVRDGAEA